MDSGKQSTGRHLPKNRRNIALETRGSFLLRSLFGQAPPATQVSDLSDPACASWPLPLQERLMQKASNNEHSCHGLVDQPTEPTGVTS